MNNKRLIWADFLKGFLIVLVVLGHAIQYGVSNNETNHIWNIIYSFHMPCFFVVSGFVCYRKNELMAIRNRLSKSIRRIKQLIVPFLIWSIIKVILCGSELFDFCNILLHPDRFFWFLWVLYIITVLFYIGDFFSAKSKLRQEVFILVMIIGLIAIMVMTDFRLFGFQFVAYYFIFYAMGYYLHKYEMSFLKRIWQFVFCGLLWFGLAWNWKMHDLPLFLKGLLPISDTYIQYSYRYLSAIVGCIFFIGLAKRFLQKENELIKMVVKLGEYSLGIYVTHLLLMEYITKLVKYFSHDISDFCVIIISFFVALIVSSVLVMFFSKSKLTNRLLLGKL